MYTAMIITIMLVTIPTAMATRENTATVSNLLMTTIMTTTEGNKDNANNKDEDDRNSQR